MTHASSRLVRVAMACGAGCVCALATALAADVAADVQEILATSGVKGGLVVHVGCGTGRLTAALRATDSFLVQGLDRDAANAAKARTHAASVGLQGKVCFAQWSGPALPYVDNLVNLLVVEGSADVARQEAMRVLCPGGVMMTRRGGQWIKALKPRPRDIDEWTHFLHDAGGNAVARDARVGPPRHMQWLAKPLWTRYHHTLSSVSTVVSANGRLFDILDEGPPGSMSVSARWSLVARDAFNGVQLWKRAIESWAWYRRGFRSGPVQLPRLLVAAGQRVYVPLGMDAPVTALDAAAGETVKTYAGTKHAEELVLDRGVLLVVTGAPAAEETARMTRRRRGKKAKSPMFRNEKTIVALDAATGAELWKWSDANAGALMPLTLAAAGGRVFFQAGQGVVCLDLKTGRERWRAGKVAESNRKPRRPGWSVATLVARAEVVLWADAGQLRAFAAGDGRPLWSCPCRPGFKSPPDVFVIGRLVWLGPSFSEGRDVMTGEVKQRSNVAAALQTAGHHHRCYRDKATDRFIMTGKRGIEFIDVVGSQNSRNNWIRGLCQYGIMPCNGLVYAPPHACGCYMEAKLIGFWAVAAGRQKRQRTRGAEARRLVKGPAYASIGHRPSAIANPRDWPTYRHDALRSGATKAEVSPQLRITWQTPAGSRLSAPVVGNGLTIVAAIDALEIVALDAATGRPRWRFMPSGPVDSPPTIFQGRVIFGCADGWVYCLRASDGALAWRFRAAPEDRRTVALGHVESVWPAHGSVLVKGGIVYAAAGRSSYLDGGISLYGLDPSTGRVVHQTRVASEQPRLHTAPPPTAPKPKRIAQNTVDFKTLLDPDKSDSFSMAGGATTDVLVSGGRSIYMRQVRFDRTLARQPTYGRHLFSTSTLLDGAENHRSHWVLGTGDFSRTAVAYSWIANSGRSRWNSRLARPYGLMLAFDERRVWGVRRYGYRLFSRPNKPFSKDEAPRPDFQPAKNQPTNAEWTWSLRLPLRPRAMLRAGKTLFVAGMPLMTGDAEADAFEGRKGGVLLAVAASNGTKLAEYRLDAPPVWDGMAAAGDKLYLSLANGRVACMAFDPHAKLPAPGPPAGRPAAMKPAPLRGAPGRPGVAVKPDSAGKLVLKPETAKTSGRLRYQPDRNNLGAWVNPKDYCEWNLRGVKAGTYAVDFTYGSTLAGTTYTIIAGDAKLSGKTENTRGLKTYKTYRVGVITLPDGDLTLAVKPGSFKGAIMNFRLLELTPVK